MIYLKLIKYWEIMEGKKLKGIILKNNKKITNWH